MDHQHEAVHALAGDAELPILFHLRGLLALGRLGLAVFQAHLFEDLAHTVGRQALLAGEHLELLAILDAQVAAHQRRTRQFLEAVVGPLLDPLLLLLKLLLIGLIAPGILEDLGRTVQHGQQPDHFLAELGRVLPLAKLPGAFLEVGVDGRRSSRSPRHSQ